MRVTIPLAMVAAAMLTLGTSCRYSKSACKDVVAVSPDNYYRQTLNTGVFTFSTQVQPKRCRVKDAQHQKGIVLTVRVYNNQDMSSPLRKVCRSMDAYNSANEYLLNKLRQDIRLEYGTASCNPTDFWFENNYNAFPFETFKVGFTPPKSFFKGHSKVAQLVYVDRVFTGDTLSFHYPKSLFQAEVKN
jgi:hypothetical protein